MKTQEEATETLKMLRVDRGCVCVCACVSSAASLVQLATATHSSVHTLFIRLYKQAFI